MTKKTTEKDEENECVTIDVSEPKEKKEKKHKKHVIAFEESVEKDDDSDEIDEDDSDDEDEDDDDDDDEVTGLTDMGLYNVLGNFLVDEDGNTIGMSLSNIAKELSKINHSIKNHGVEKKDKKKSA